MIVVTNTNDSGPGSLRAAIAAAALGEEIIFAVSGTITLTSAELLIVQDVIITGPGRAALTLATPGTLRIFNITGGVVSISGMTLGGGVGALGAAIHNETTLTLDDISIGFCTSSNDGGAIWNSSTITMTDCDIISSTASAGDGGGIYNNGTITATNLNVGNCTCSNDGAGIWNSGTFTHSGGEVVQNTASNFAGGVYNEGTYSPTEVVFDNNTAAGNGGGIHNTFGTTTVIRCASANNDPIGIYNSAGTVDVDNSTISNNVVSGIVNSLGSMSVLHSTIVQNVYGISQDSGSLVFIQNTILSGNGTNDYDGDTADVVSNGNNIFGNNTNPITPASGDQTVLLFADLVLGPLQDNGGPTETHEVLAGSPAIDAGNSTGAPDTDQRGSGFPRVINGTIDIGAFESNITPPTPPDPIPPIPPPTPEPPAPPTPPSPSTVRTCPNPPSPCPRPEDPVINNSSEAPDTVDYFSGAVFVSDWDPPLGQPWSLATACGVTCIRSTQEEANQCAADLAASCQETKNPIIPNDVVFPRGGAGDPMPPIPPTVPTVVRTLYPNEEINLVDRCPDGTPFTYTVAAGTFKALTQIQADQMAIAKAEQEVKRLRWCINPINGRFCHQQPISAQFTVSGYNPSVPLTNYPIVLVSGEYPTGIAFIQNFPGIWTATGIPTTDGTYEFTVRITNWDGTSKESQMSMEIWGITTENVPDGAVGSPYSEQIAVSGTPSGDVYSIVSGNLPDGLALSPTGLISGTPTTELGYAFTVGVTRGGVTCTQDLSITIEAEAVCPELKSTITVGIDGLNAATYGLTENLVYVLTGDGSSATVRAYDISDTQVLSADQGVAAAQDLAYSQLTNRIYACVGASPCLVNMLDATDLSLLNQLDVTAYGNNGALRYIDELEKVLLHGSGGIALIDPSTNTVDADSTTGDFDVIQADYCPTNTTFYCPDNGTASIIIRNSSLVQTGSIALADAFNQVRCVYVPSTDIVLAAAQNSLGVLVLYLIDPATNTVTSTVSDGLFGLPSAMEYDPSLDLVYIAATADDRLVTFNPADNTIICSLDVSTSTTLCRQIAVNTTTDRFYVPTLQQSLLKFGQP